MTVDRTDGATDEEPVVVLQRWWGTWDRSDPNAAFKDEVTQSALMDPLPPLEVLADMTGIPLGAIVRFVLTRYVSSGSEALLTLGVSEVLELRAICETAEQAGTDGARLDAFAQLRGRLSWLASGVDPPDPRGKAP